MIDSSWSPKLAICVPLFYSNLVLDDRIRRIADAGFGVLLWDWRDLDLHSISRIPNVWISGIDCVSQFHSRPVPASMLHPHGALAYLDGVRQSLDAAEQLGCSELLLVTGEFDSMGKPSHPVADLPASRWATAYRVLMEVAELAEKRDVTFGLENLNTKVDHPGYMLPRVEDVVDLLESVNSPRVRLNLDLYHAQVQEGNLVQLIHGFSRWIGHIQLADVPGRGEPGTGEVRYERVASALREIGYGGVIDLEATPRDNEEVAMERFRNAMAAAA